MTCILRRRVLAASAIAALGIGIVPRARAFADRKFDVALVMKSLDDPFVVAMLDGAKNYQRHYASQLDLTASGTATEGGTAQQIRIVDELIGAKTNAIVIAPTDSTAIVPVVAKAIAAGIIVIAIDNPFDDAAQDAANVSIPFVGPDSRRGARLVAQYLAQRLTRGDEVGVIEGAAADRNSRDRTVGFREALEAAGVRIVAVESGDWSVGSGRVHGLAMLNAHPEIRALLCANDNIAIGAAAVVRAMGKKGRVYVTGYNNIDQVRPLLADGSVLATVEQFAAKQAVFGIDVALKALAEGRKQRDLSPYIATPLELVTGR
ncbi:ribose transport system, substrate-binding protein [Caballeronia terrestris]|jgi:ribose transport system substrate-binding protein|uniref:Ribose transport system, substrate-binding protein n=1 Tax=Caballeronia terrestris TaxID=1226301 RepID=A0A158K8Y5_9BURK|nr:substrate-binding domain-containing protein [Caballeronia terrestris]SAL76911.1 ribose transport system, substrate-binding protein [Caballeronia terrestris]